MKMFLAAACLLIASMVQATEVQRLQSSGAKYEVFEIYETDIKQATLLVDYRQVETDCKGLEFRYEVIRLKNGSYFVTKRPLLKTFQICSPDVIQIVQDGIKIELPIDARAGKTSLVTEIIAPADSSVEVQVIR